MGQPGSWNVGDTFRLTLLNTGRKQENMEERYSVEDEVVVVIFLAGASAGNIGEDGMWCRFTSPPSRASIPRFAVCT